MKPGSFKVYLLTLFSAMVAIVNAQDLEELLADEMDFEQTVQPVIFRSTSIINGHSITTLPKGTLEFRIEHRFGTLNDGAYELWGIDNASIHFSFEYGLADWLMIGAGRGTYEKTYDSFIKFQPLKQKSGKESFPFSVSWQSAAYINTLQFLSDLDGYQFSQRIEQVHQVMLARKFGEAVSIQIMPSYLKRTPNPSIMEQSDLFAAGAGFSLRVSKQLSVNIEYYPVLNKDNSQNLTPIYDPLSFGVDLETGGHVFQLMLTNSRSMTEHGIIGNTTGSWLNGDIHFGFNVSRVFQTGKSR